MKDDDIPIEELCRPLSAKVMPKRLMMRTLGDEISPEEARAIDHTAQINRLHRKMGKIQRKGRAPTFGRGKRCTADRS